jgi:hypothetical protein
MSDIPIILLDWDGCVNAVCSLWDMPEHFREFEAQGFYIRYDPVVVEFFNDLHTSGRAEVRFLSTWYSCLPDLAPSGILPFPAANTAEEFLAENWWKLPVAQRVHAEGRPVIWIDDDLAYEVTARNWIEQEDNVLAISPRTHEGLTDSHLEEISAWLQDHSTS